MKYLVLSLFLCFSLQSYAQGCCSASSKPNAEFAALGKDGKFRTAHPSPKRLKIVPSGNMVQFDTPDGSSSQAYRIGGPEEGKKFLLVIHEWWGLNEHIKSESDRMFRELDAEVEIWALDLYDGMIASTPEAASKLMQDVVRERALAIIAGALAQLPKDAEVATVGWCFGGGWSLQTSIELGKRAKGCVIYYGMPEENLERLGTLQADVLGIFASEDQWINQEVVDRFEANMVKSGDHRKLTHKVFQANHAFANPSSERYEATACREANEMSIEFIRTKLGLE